MGDRKKEEGRKVNGRDTSISLLCISATVCVIFLHACSILTDNKELFNITDSQSALFNTLYQIMYWAVPIFFMITGALMLGRVQVIINVLLSMYEDYY